MGPEVYFKVLGVTFLLLGGFLLVVYLLKKGRMPASKEGTIQIKEVRPLGFKAQLILLEVKDRTFLLGLSEKGIDLIKEWENEKGN